MSKIKVTVWNEYVHEVESKEIASVYPDGIHNCIADFLREADMDVKTATLRMPEHGLTDDVLSDTDVLIWWGHMAHREVEDAVVNRVHKRVLDGMGLIALHSSHCSKIFTKLCGTRGALRWREAGEKEILWVVNPSHPIVDGLEEKIMLPHEEMYGECFEIPAPDDLVFISWFEGGEVFRSGLCYTRGKGKIFYFRPGHESYPTYKEPAVQKVMYGFRRTTGNAGKKSSCLGRISITWAALTENTCPCCARRPGIWR